MHAVGGRCTAARRLQGAARMPCWVAHPHTHSTCLSTTGVNAAHPACLPAGRPHHLPGPCRLLCARRQRPRGPHRPHLHPGGVPRGVGGAAGAACWGCMLLARAGWGKLQARRAQRAHAPARLHRSLSPFPLPSPHPLSTLTSEHLHDRPHPSRLHAAPRHRAVRCKGTRMPLSPLRERSPLLLAGRRTLAGRLTASVSTPPVHLCSSLCIVDEFGKGTLAADGVGLLCATLRHFAGLPSPPRVVLCTHFRRGRGQGAVCWLCCPACLPACLRWLPAQRDSLCLPLAPCPTQPSARCCRRSTCRAARSWPSSP